MKKIADGETWTVPATIEDPKVLDDIKEAVRRFYPHASSGINVEAANARPSDDILATLLRRFVEHASEAGTCFTIALRDKAMP